MKTFIVQIAEEDACFRPVRGTYDQESYLMKEGAVDDVAFDKTPWSWTNNADIAGVQTNRFWTEIRRTVVPPRSSRTAGQEANPACAIDAVTRHRT